MKQPYLITAIALTIMSLLWSCGAKNSPASVAENQTVTIDSAETIVPRHAAGFSVSYRNGYTLLEIADPQHPDSRKFRYALVKDNYNVDIPDNCTIIKIPVKSVVCMTSLQLSNFLKLGLADRVSGITSTRHLHDSIMNERLRKELTHKIGIEGNFDNEIIMSLNPDLIFISPFKRGGYEALRNIDLPLVPHLGYKELTPLGQAEWIKVVGLLTGKAASANKTFEGIERRYNELKAMTESVAERPRVFSGEMRSGNWYAVGGKSFLAQLFADAGADYFLDSNNESGGVTLDYETVYSNAVSAPYWRIVNSFDGDFSYDALASLDTRYTDFDAWKHRGVIYCNMNEVPFYERMPVEPEVVLADFIYVFHPELIPDHKPVYYHLLK